MNWLGFAREYVIPRIRDAKLNLMSDGDVLGYSHRQVLDLPLYSSIERIVLSGMPIVTRGPVRGQKATRSVAAVRNIVPLCPMSLSVFQRKLASAF